MNMRAALACLALTAASNQAISAPDSHRCSSINSDSERLACYDKAFGTPAAPPNSAPPKPEFGLPAKKAYPGVEDKKDSEIRAAVSSVTRQRDGKFVVTLDNGQTWQQSEIDSRVGLEVGDTVNVRRAALGSYLLSNEDGIATRVKRVR